MGVSSALGAATAGLRLAQNGLDFTAQNVASAGVAGYTRKILQPSQRVIGEKVVGISTQSIARVLDTLLQKQLRTESAGGEYTKIQSSYFERLDTLYGPPGSSTAVDATFSNFMSALEQLVTSPESPQAQSAVLEKAKLFTSRLNGLSNDIQTMRSEAEQGIADGISQVNDLLRRLKGLNEQIISSSIGAGEPVNLLDQRDQLLNDLGRLMDIKVTNKSDNSVTVYTSTGALLFDSQPAVLAFDGRSSLTPESLYNTDSSLRTVGTITLTTPGGYSIDLIGQNSIRSGSISSYITLRDDVLVNAQNNLDELASSMALALSAQTQASTTIVNGRQIDLAQFQPGDSLTVSVTSGGVPRTVTIVRVDDASQLPISADQVAGTSGEVYGVSFANLATAATGIQTILGTGFTVSNPAGTALNFVDNAGTTDVTGLQARISATGLNGGAAGLAFFSDPGSSSAIYSANMEEGPQKIGFAQRIAVNSALLADPTRLINMGTGAYDAGDPTRPQAILERLTSIGFDFAPSSGLNAGSVNETVKSYMQRIINNIGQGAATAKQLEEGQTIVVNGLQERFDEDSKVNIDDEIARLVELQQTYQASARIMAVVSSLLKELMDMSVF